MSERTLRERIEALYDFKTGPHCGGYISKRAVLDILDAHTAAQPAPVKRPAREQMTLCDDCGKELPHDAAVWTTDGASYCPKCRPQIAAAPVMDQPAPDAAAEALETAASIADEYAAENFRMATDSVFLDRAQRFSDTEERQIEGNGHSAAGITARNIAAAIRALADKDTA